jgi:hypothetical protein
MTLRQFAFLAGGAVIAYVIYVLPLPNYLKYPLVIFFAGGGAATAFVPINERPLDRWVAAFFRAVFGPTRRVWIKSPDLLELFTRSYAVATPTVLPTTSEEDRQRLEEYLATLPPRPEEAVDKTERKLLEKIDFTLGQVPTTTQKPAESKAIDTTRPSYAPQVTPLPKPLQVKDQDGQEKILPQLTGVRVRRLGSGRVARGEFTLPTPPTPTTSSPPPSQTQPSQRLSSPSPSDKSKPPLSEPTELFAAEKEVVAKVKEEVKKHDLLQSYQEQVKRLETEKEILQEKVKEGHQQAEKLKIQRAKQQTQPQPATELASKPPKTKTPREESQKPTQPPDQRLNQLSPPPTRPVKKLVLPTITDTPNVINGVVADQQGELLEEAILVIKDSESTPVRALKTNKLGQFTISTPLRNGTYSIEVEKEGYTFEPIYQEVTGTILPPREIRAK